MSYASDITVNTASCTASPCNFIVSGEPGQLYMIYVYAVQQNFRSSPAQVQRNTGAVSVHQCVHDIKVCKHLFSESFTRNKAIWLAKGQAFRSFPFRNFSFFFFFARLQVF